MSLFITTVIEFFMYPNFRPLNLPPFPDDTAITEDSRKEFFSKGFNAVKEKFFSTSSSYKAEWDKVLKWTPKFFFWHLCAWRKFWCFDETMLTPKVETSAMKVVEIQKLDLEYTWKMGYFLGVLDVFQQMLEMGHHEMKLVEFLNNVEGNFEDEDFSHKTFHAITQFFNTFIVTTILAHMEADLNAAVVDQWKVEELKRIDVHFKDAEKLVHLLEEHDDGTVTKFLFGQHPDMKVERVMHMHHPSGVKRLKKKFMQSQGQSPKFYTGLKVRKNVHCSGPIEFHDD